MIQLIREAYGHIMFTFQTTGLKIKLINALFNGKYSPDIEDVKVVAKPILRHRIVKNYKAEAEGITEKQIIDSLL